MALTFEQQQALGNLKTLTISGLILAAIGGLVLALSWPHLDGAGVTGSTAGVAIGWAILAVGGCLLFTGLVGWGVKVGSEAATITRATAD